MLYTIRGRNYPVIYTMIKQNKREALDKDIENVIHNKSEELPSDIHYDKTQQERLAALPRFVIVLNMSGRFALTRRE